MVFDLKTSLYNLLSNTLQYQVFDNPYAIEENEDIECPFLIVRIDNITRDKFKGNFVYQVKVKIDIFSNYDGEKEVLDIEENIFDNIQQLYDLKPITYFRESAFRVIDDKSTGVAKKHGIITYHFYINGNEIVTPDETNEEQNNEQGD